MKFSTIVFIGNAAVLLQIAGNLQECVTVGQIFHWLSKNACIIIVTLSSHMYAQLSNLLNTYEPLAVYPILSYFLERLLCSNRPNGLPDEKLLTMNIILYISYLRQCSAGMYHNNL